MKKLIISALLMSATLVPVLFGFGYELTDNDYILVDKVEEALIEYTEIKGNISLEKLVNALDVMLLTRSLSERSAAIIETIVDDLNWYLSLDEDELVLTKEDCYDDEYFDKEDQWCYLK